MHLSRLPTRSAHDGYRSLALVGPSDKDGPDGKFDVSHNIYIYLEIKQPWRYVLSCSAMSNLASCRQLVSTTAKLHHMIHYQVPFSIILLLSRLLPQLLIDLSVSYFLVFVMNSYLCPSHSTCICGPVLHPLLTSVVSSSSSIISSVLLSCALSGTNGSEALCAAGGCPSIITLGWRVGDLDLSLRSPASNCFQSFNKEPVFFIWQMYSP